MSSRKDSKHKICRNEKTLFSFIQQPKQLPNMSGNTHSTLKTNLTAIKT